MAHLKLEDLKNEATTVDMFDHTYEVREITRSVQKKLEKVDAELNALQGEDDSDKVVAGLIDGLDALLAPADGAPAVKRALTEAWKADKLSLAQLHGLFDGVQEASVKRPT